MRTPTAFLILTISLSFIWLGCASTEAERKVESQIAAEKGEGSISSIGFHKIQDHPKLSKEQKQKLIDIHARTGKKIAKIRRKLAKVKGAFFHTLLKQGPRQGEIDVLRKKLTALNDEKIDIMMEALIEAKDILGGLGDRDLYESFMHEGKIHEHTK
jgi:hypothetical protein